MLFKKEFVKTAFNAYTLMTAIGAVSLLVYEALNDDDNGISSNLFKYFMDSGEPNEMFNTPFADDCLVQKNLK